MTYVNPAYTESLKKNPNMVDKRDFRLSLRITNLRFVYQAHGTDNAVYNVYFMSTREVGLYFSSIYSNLYKTKSSLRRSFM